VEKEPIEYRLQIQLRSREVNDDKEVFNPSQPWDRTKFPWLDIATIQLTQLLHPCVTERTHFDFMNQPPSLCIEGEADSLYDYRSVVHFRQAATSGSYAGRMQFHEIVNSGYTTPVIMDGVVAAAGTPYTIKVEGVKLSGCPTGARASCIVIGPNKTTDPIDLTRIMGTGREGEATGNVQIRYPYFLV
jgi:hypothetical protein